jgi:hypothetical protein
MFYSKWWIYKNIYLRINEKRLIKNYLKEVRAGDKPLFIHINKTAGSSIAKSLGITESHCSLETYEKLYEKYFNENFNENVKIWTAIRNPFDKVTSQYFYRIKTNQNKLGENTISFDEWVKAAFDDKDPIYRDWDLMFDTQSNWIKNNKSYQVNFIRFENLNDDYNKVASLYNGTSLAWRKKSSNKNYKEHFSDYSRAVIEREFKEDLERFNYSF